MRYLFNIILLLSPALADHIDEFKLYNEVFRKDQSVITYYLQQHDERAKTLAVLIQGSDCNSIYNNQFVLQNFSNITPNTDVLLVEKYGITKTLPYLNDEERKDCPTTYLEHDSITQRVEDYAQILDNLKDQYHNIYLIGGSEGAVVAALLSEKLSFLKAAILMNGGGQFFIDDILYFIETNVPNSQLAEVKKGFYQSLNQVLNKGNQHYLSGHGHKWWMAMTALDLQNTLNKSQNKILYIQTLNDQNVNWKGALEMSKRVESSNVEFIFVEGQNHFFENEQGERTIDEMLILIKDWLTKNLP